jgi:hypothetical protein
VQLFRPGLSIAELTQPGPAQRISLLRRSLRDCLAEELRRLDADEVFGETVRSLRTLGTKTRAAPLQLWWETVTARTGIL